MAERLATLGAVEAAIWHELGRCVADKSHGWRTPVLATVDGERADARTVVLREVDERQRQLLFYSDERAGKEQEDQLGERPSQDPRLAILDDVDREPIPAAIGGQVRLCLDAHIMRQLEAIRNGPGAQA